MVRTVTYSLIPHSEHTDPSFHSCLCEQLQPSFSHVTLLSLATLRLSAKRFYSTEHTLTQRRITWTCRFETWPSLHEEAECRISSRYTSEDPTYGSSPSPRCWRTPPCSVLRLWPLCEAAGAGADGDVEDDVCIGLVCKIDWLINGRQGFSLLTCKLSKCGHGRVIVILESREGVSNGMPETAGQFMMYSSVSRELYKAFYDKKIGTSLTYISTKWYPFVASIFHLQQLEPTKLWEMKHAWSSPSKHSKVVQNQRVFF